MKKIILFCLILMLALPSAADATKEQYRFMLDDNPKVIGGGGYDATVSWGGREIKVSQLQEEFGTAATRRLWNKLDRDNKFEILKGYEGWFGQPAYLDKHFGQDVRTEIVQFYARNTVIAKLRDQSAERRVSDMLSETINKARNVYSYGNAGNCVEAEKLTKKITDDRADLEKLITMANRLEAEKIGIALFEASKFGAEQFVGFITGNVYTQASKMSSLIAEVIMQAKSRWDSAMDSEPSAADVIRLKNDLQDIYLSGADNLANRILEDKEKLDKAKEACEEEQKKKQEEKQEEAQKAEDQEKEAARKVNTTPVAVSVSYIKDEKAEDHERRLAWAAASTLGNISYEFSREASRLYGEFLEVANTIWQNDEMEALKKDHQFYIYFYYWHPPGVGAFYSLYLNETIPPYASMSSLKQYMNKVDKDLAPVAAYQGYHQNLLGQMERIQDNAVSILTEIEGRRRGVISQYGGLMRKYGVGWPREYDIPEMHPVNFMIKHIARATALDEEIGNTYEKMEESAKNAAQHYSELEAIYREAQSKYDTVATNLYLAIGKLDQEKATYMNLLGTIGVTPIAGNTSWNQSTSSLISKALNENYLTVIRELMAEKKFNDASAKMDELFREAEAINDQHDLVRRVLPYVEGALNDVRGYISSIGYLASGINQAIADPEVRLAGPMIEDPYTLFREYSGGSYSPNYFIRDVVPVRVDHFFEGNIIIGAAEDYNREYESYLNKKKSEMNSARSGAAGIINAVLYEKAETYNVALQNAQKLIWAAYPSFWEMKIEFAEKTPGYERWLPTLNAYNNGKRLPDIDTKENMDLYRSIIELQSAVYSDIIGKANAERAERSAQVGISIASILVNGQQYQYPITLLENFTGTSVTVSGVVHTGVGLDSMTITVDGREMGAALGKPSFNVNRVETPYSLKVPVVPGEDAEIRLMAYLDRNGRGTGFTLRPFDTGSVSREVTEFYDRFRQRYADGDLSGVMEFVADDWSATGRDKTDLENRLDEIFYTFGTLSVSITNLQVKASKSNSMWPGQASYFAEASYHIKIRGQLQDSPDIQHNEEGDVTDYLVKDNGKLLIGKTVGRGFF